MIARSAVVLAYHDIVPDGPRPLDYAVSVSRFRRQLDVAAALGYRFRTLRELSGALVAGEDVRRTASVVFDDALIGVHELAMPILAERGIPWTLLPVTERLGALPPWWEGARRTMTAGEVAEAVGAGADLCAHTATHVSLPDVPEHVAADELRRCRETLGEWAGREVLDLCYPFGHQNARVRELAREAGFRTGWTFTNGRCAPGDDLFRLPRLAMIDGRSDLRWAATLLRPKASWPAVEDLAAATGERP